MSTFHTEEFGALNKEYGDMVKSIEQVDDTSVCLTTLEGVQASVRLLAKGWQVSS
jgi:hypothetical protein